METDYNWQNVHETKYLGVGCLYGYKYWGICNNLLNKTWTDFEQTKLEVDSRPLKGRDNYAYWIIISECDVTFEIEEVQI